MKITQNHAYDETADINKLNINDKTPTTYYKIAFIILYIVWIVTRGMN